MSRQINDEEVPLLPKTKRTPLPWGQFSIVLFLQLAEPLTSNVIYPFVPQLIRDIGITHGDEARVGYYVGLMQSLFFLTQAFTVLHWSRISDRVGRKPIILTGLFGLSMSMFSFGLSRTFWGLVLSRSLNGALNGNIGVIKSMMAELTDPTNISQAYAAMPLAWSTGGTLGPIIGGSLSRPVERFPHLFGNSEFLKKYPYFLPCAVPATFSLCAWLVVFFFLKETVATPLSISTLFRFRRSKANLTLQNVAVSQEPSAALLPSPIPPATPQRSASPTPSVSPTPTLTPASDDKPLSLLSLLTYRVVASAGNYASLSLIDIAYRGIQPLFYSTPISRGGLGLSPPIIGNILSVFGILNGIVQIFFFAKIHDRWGSRNTFVLGIASSFGVFATFPILSILAKSSVNGEMPLSVWITIFIQIALSICMSFSYGAVFIFITASAPNRASLGAVNGLSQMSVSVMRAIGPALASSLFSLSMEHGYLGGHLVYVVLMAISIMGLVVASFLPKRVWTD